MSVFESVTVVREANIYFDGKVTSRTVIFADGSKKTLGIMLPGEYTFGTDAPEVIAIRLTNARQEIAHASECEYVIINAVFSTALTQLQTIVDATRLRYAVQLARSPEIFNPLGLS